MPMMFFVYLVPSTATEDVKLDNVTVEPVPATALLVPLALLDSPELPEKTDILVTLESPESAESLWLCLPPEALASSALLVLLVLLVPADLLDPPDPMEILDKMETKVARDLLDLLDLLEMPEPLDNPDRLEDPDNPERLEREEGDNLDLLDPLDQLDNPDSLEDLDNLEDRDLLVSQCSITIIRNFRTTWTCWTRRKPWSSWRRRSTWRPWTGRIPWNREFFFSRPYYRYIIGCCLLPLPSPWWISTSPCCSCRSCRSFWQLQTPCRLSPCHGQEAPCHEKEGCCQEGLSIQGQINLSQIQLLIQISSIFMTCRWRCFGAFSCIFVVSFLAFLYNTAPL